MRVGFTGTQKGMTDFQKGVLVLKLSQFATLLVHGGEEHADDEADAIAVSLGIPRSIFPATGTSLKIAERCRARGGVFTLHPEHPPLVRNKLIVGEIERLLACPRQSTEILRSGTWATVRYGRKALGEANVEVIAP